MPSGRDAWRLHRKQAQRASTRPSKLPPPDSLSGDSGNTMQVQRSTSSQKEHCSENGSTKTLPLACGDLRLAKRASSDPGLSPTCIVHMVQQMRLYIDTLTENFIHGYFESARDSKSLATIMTHWASPTSPTFKTGNNALALSHFGGAIRDQRISH